jgi:hypothetical protein
LIIFVHKTLASTHSSRGGQVTLLPFYLGSILRFDRAWASFLQEKRAFYWIHA